MVPQSPRLVDGDGARQASYASFSVSSDGNDELIRCVRLQSVNLAANFERFLLGPRRLRRAARLPSGENLLERAIF